MTVAVSSHHFIASYSLSRTKLAKQQCGILYLVLLYRRVHYNDIGMYLLVLYWSICSLINVCYITACFALYQFLQVIRSVTYINVPGVPPTGNEEFYRYRVSISGIKHWILLLKMLAANSLNLVLCSWQRPSGWNILHHILNYCYVFCSRMTLQPQPLWITGKYTVH